MGPFSEMWARTKKIRIESEYKSRTKGQSVVRGSSVCVVRDQSQACACKLQSRNKMLCRALIVLRRC
jgi:hypothetical protein